MLRANQLAVIGVVLTAACVGDLLGPFGDVEIRVRNVSDTAMTAVVVGFPDGDVAYGDVGPGETTGYREVDRAYRYAAVEAVVLGDTARLFPIDYVGEELPEPGRYTYELGLTRPGSIALRLADE